MIETLNEQQQVLQQRLAQAIESRETTLEKFVDAQQEITTVTAKLSTATNELSAEQRAHAKSEAQFDASLSDKEAVVQQLQAALLALAPTDQK